MGLSALMTTTVTFMEETIALLRQESEENDWSKKAGLIVGQLERLEKNGGFFPSVCGKRHCIPQDRMI